MKQNSISTVCIHCSAGCSLEYKVDDGSIHTDSQCNVAKVSLNFSNTILKNEDAFNSAVIALQNAEAIRFSSMITNEDAKILQVLKEKLGIKLFNEDARLYGVFMKAYSSISTKLHHSASLDTLKQADAIISIGGRISTDNPAVRYALESAYRDNNASVVYAHPIEDAVLKDSITQFIKYEAGSEEGVMALLANELFSNVKLSDADRAYFDDLDLGYLEAESNVGADELEQITQSFKDAKNCVLVVGSDVFAHKRSSNIAKFAAMIEKYTNFSLLIIPSKINTVGVSLIADLDRDEALKNVVAYNGEGSFIISALEDADLGVAALNQQDGTIVNIDNEVLKLHAAFESDTYGLSDLAKSLAVSNQGENTYIKEFSDLVSAKAVGLDMNATLEEVAELPEYNGTVIYHSNPLVQFDAYTNLSPELQKDSRLRGSAQFASVAKVSDGDEVEIQFGSEVIKREFKLDATLKGTIALHPSFDINIDNSLYKFLKSNIMRVEK